MWVVMSSTKLSPITFVVSSNDFPFLVCKLHEGPTVIFSSRYTLDTEPYSLNPKPFACTSNLTCGRGTGATGPPLAPTCSTCRACPMATQIPQQKDSLYTPILYIPHITLYAPKPYIHLTFFPPKNTHSKP